MGSILSNQNSVEDQKSGDDKNMKMTKNWEVLQRTDYKQILKSKKTSLIVERYWFQMENFQDFQSQNKLFQWRNHNPNSQFMVNVLSVGKDDSGSEDRSFECGSIEWCPSEKILTKIYVVTQRILKLGEINDVLKFQKQMEDCTQNNKNKILYATDLSPKTIFDNKSAHKIQPFIGVNFSQALARQLLKDWLRGIEVLCYKFGYFSISQHHLGMTLERRGTSWISRNYSLNHLNQQNKIQVNTADQKFKYEKQTIQKIIALTQSIPCFKNTINVFKQKKIERFDQFCNLLDQISKSKKKNRQHTSYQPQIKNNNNSLHVEHGSFLTPNYVTSQNNSNFFMFDHQNALNRVNSNTKMNSNQKILSLQTSLQNRNSKHLLNSANSKELPKEQIQRSNTGEKVIKNISLQSRQQFNFVNSNHKYCGKQTAPTNQLGHSSSLQSVNNDKNLKSNFEQLNNKKPEGKTMFKSQKNTKIQAISQNQNELFKPSSSPSNKIYFHQNIKNSFSSEPYIFRSHAANDFKSPRSPRPNENMSFNSPMHRSPKEVYHNYSLDQNNIVGPYRKDRIYSNLRKQKIALVDSMVMVREQSEQIQEDLHNLSRGKYILEESIIIMGRHEDPILHDIYR